jgi:hypothetical protein
MQTRGSPAQENIRTDDDQRSRPLARLPRRAPAARGPAGAAMDHAGPRRVRADPRALGPRRSLALHPGAHARAVALGARAIGFRRAVDVGLRIGVGISVGVRRGLALTNVRVGRLYRSIRAEASSRLGLSDQSVHGEREARLEERLLRNGRRYIGRTAPEDWPGWVCPINRCDAQYLGCSRRYIGPIAPEWLTRLYLSDSSVHGERGERRKVWLPLNARRYVGRTAPAERLRRCLSDSSARRRYAGAADPDQAIAAERLA